MPPPRITRVKRLGLVLLVSSVLSADGCTAILLDERFFDVRLKEWTVIDDPDTVEGPSRWRVESDGWLHQYSNIWGRRGDFIGRWYGTMLVTGAKEWSTYTLSVRAKPDDNDGFGVIFRFKDPEHFYRLLFVKDGLSGGPITRLDKRDGPDYTELWSDQQGYRLGRVMLITVRVNRDQITGEVDGKELF